MTDPASRSDSASSLATYDPVQRALHWIVGLLFLTAIAVVLLDGLPSDRDVRMQIVNFHKSLGLTVLVLGVVRLAYRFVKAPPDYPPSYDRRARIAASISHWLLYGLIIVMPLTGYLASALLGRPLPWFGLFSFPNPFEANEALGKLIGKSHKLLAYLVYASVAAHIGSTLWHEFVKKDGSLARMLPRRAKVSPAE
jgi:cytochrome b561